MSQLSRSALLLLQLLVLVAAAAFGPRLEAATCGDSVPASVVDAAVTLQRPSDVDRTARPSPTTTLRFSFLIPEHCPGQRFPLVLHSAGYGGTRLRAMAASAALTPGLPQFAAMDQLAAALPYYGYVVLSVDLRGQGESVPAYGGGYARIIDPAVETQDLIDLLNWVYEHATEYSVETEPDSGIARDLKVGTIGYSYGGGYQLPLAALDPRIDAIVPNNTWHSLMNALVPGAAVKTAWDGILCTAAAAGGVVNTPVVQALCYTLGLSNPSAFDIRSYEDALDQLSGASGQVPPRPRPVARSEIEALLMRHGMSDFRARQLKGIPWGYGETEARLRPVPTLLLQGNRDELFNLNEGFWNWRYFREAGGDARLLSTEGGHMNPQVGQVEGTPDCGNTSGTAAVLAWFGHYLQGGPQSLIDDIPQLCISVAPSGVVPASQNAGVRLASFPLGSQQGSGAVPARRAALDVRLESGRVAPVFVPVVTVSTDGAVLAGAPTIGRLDVSGASPTGQSTNAFVGVGLLRGGRMTLVDDQVTAFSAGVHTVNRNVAQDGHILLPALGEALQRGDQLGLLFFPQHVQFAALNGVMGVTSIAKTIARELDPDSPYQPLIAALEPIAGTYYVNPYRVRAEDIELPVFVPGSFPGSSWSR